MKRFFIGVLLLFTLLPLSGCGTPSKEAAQKTVNDFFTDLQFADYEKAYDLLAVPVGTKAQYTADKKKNPQPMTGFDVKDVSTTGETGSAKVLIKIANPLIPELPVTATLKVVDGQWKISNINTPLASTSQDANQPFRSRESKKQPKSLAQMGRVFDWISNDKYTVYANKSEYVKTYEGLFGVTLKPGETILVIDTTVINETGEYLKDIRTNAYLKDPEGNIYKSELLSKNGLPPFFSIEPNGRVKGPLVFVVPENRKGQFVFYWDF